jgi:hypothetical protein
MKALQFFAAALAATTLLASCVKEDVVNLPADDEQEIGLILTGEEQAAKTFNNFLNHLNENPETRATIVSNPKIVGIRKTNTLQYLGNETETRSGQNAFVYELDLQNPDKTTGYAVVGSESLFDEVFAYSPIGSIADTTYNIGLSSYFNELALLINTPITGSANEGDYWQPGWDFGNIFNEIVDGTEEIYAWITPENTNDYPYNYRMAPTHRIDITSAYVPVKWSQQSPYNKYISAYIPGTTQRAAVGCHAVAVGQLMAYHRQPKSRYNWSLISNKVTPTTTAETNEVARLLADVAKRAGTVWIGSSGSGSTYHEDIIPSLNKEGYSIYEIYKGSEGASSVLILDEIRNYNRPVLYVARTSTQGHMWVIDAILEQYRWYYQRTGFIGYPPEHPIGKITRYQRRGRLLHCNWGWGGESNGWFFDFRVPHNGNTYNFSYEKYIYMGIKYVGF